MGIGTSKEPGLHITPKEATTLVESHHGVSASSSSPRMVRSSSQPVGVSGALSLFPLSLSLLLSLSLTRGACARSLAL